jgi:two-component system osmolarity sensor histidine kinase EnvZ
LKLEEEGLSGLLVSFRISGEDYWLALPRERIERQLPWEWIGWSAAAALLALVGALVHRFADQSPARSADAGGRAGRWRQSTAGAARRSARPNCARSPGVQSDDGSIAARGSRARPAARGVSHDLRTPLSRMRLAIEMLGREDRPMTKG